MRHDPDGAGDTTILTKFRSGSLRISFESCVNQILPVISSLLIGRTMAYSKRSATIGSTFMARRAGR